MFEFISFLDTVLGRQSEINSSGGKDLGHMNGSQAMSFGPRSKGWFWPVALVI